MSRPWRALALLSLMLPGCSAGLGEFCWTDDDCEAELRCSAAGTYVDGDRGVCTYPEGVPDAAAPDLGLPDLAGSSEAVDLRPETASDLGLDSGPETASDLGLDLTPDAPSPDAPLPDATRGTE